MINRKLIPVTAVILIAILACNVPAAQVAGPDLAATYAAQTVAVELTLAGITGQTPNVPLQATTQAVVPPTTQPTPTWTIMPTITLTPVPCNKVKFIDDLSIPDNTILALNAAFTKMWRIRNDGTCTWTTTYSVFFDSGAQMGAASSIPLTRNVYPGETYDISIPMTAPSSAGTYRGNWKMKDQNGTNFITNPLYVQIIAQAGGNTIVYNFADNYCAASWVSGAGVLPCPGPTNDIRGFVVRQDSPKWSNGGQEDEHAVETHPQWVDDGVISGLYPGFNVLNGDKFVSDIGCLYGGSACNFKYQVTYKSDGGPLSLLIQGTKVYGEGPTRINVDLSSLAGHSVQFALVVMANGVASQDWAVWLMPSIRR
ncbi:MAG: NBR1-Ig-like domain-containing protein [Anaerolineaceae bacterium]